MDPYDYGHSASIGLNNRVDLPALGFGVFQTPPEVTEAAVEAALRVGLWRPSGQPRRGFVESVRAGAWTAVEDGSREDPSHEDSA